MSVVVVVVCHKRGPLTKNWRDLSKNGAMKSSLFPWMDGVFIIVDFLCALRHLQHHAPLLKPNNRPTIDDRGGFFRWGAPQLQFWVTARADLQKTWTLPIESPST
jgi:hypothetical protein